jgi:hypothetical protein
VPSPSLSNVTRYPSSLPTHGSWPLISIVLSLLLLGAGTILLAYRRTRSRTE